MLYCKNQITDALEELYWERVSEVNKNKSMLQKLKIKNDYYIDFTSSIIHHYKSNGNVRLSKYVLLKFNMFLINIIKHKTNNLF